MIKGASLFLIIFLAASAVYCDNPAPLQLTVKADWKEYRLNDTIRITFIFKNVSDDDVSFIPFPKGYACRKNWIEVRDARGILMRGACYGKQKRRAFTKSDVVTLKPGHEYFTDIAGRVAKYKLLCLDLEDGSIIFLDDGYGRYNIESALKFNSNRYRDGRRKLTDKSLWLGDIYSNRVSIDIKPF